MKKAIKEFYGLCAQCKVARAVKRISRITHHRHDNGGEPYTKKSRLSLCAGCAAVMSRLIAKGEVTQ